MSAEVALLGRVLSLTAQSDCSIHEIGEAVALSPDLSSQVVKVANSALYGMAGRVTTLDRAVLILGVDAVAGIASSLVMADTLRHPPIGSLPSDALWLHSLEIGVCAELVSRVLGWSVGSQAYLAGLLHDLGIRALLDVHGAGYAQLLERVAHDAGDLLALERSTFGETHTERVARQSESWAFPDALCSALAHHHDPSALRGTGATLATLVHAAHIIVSQPLGGFGDRCAGDRDDAELLGDLGLADDDIADVREVLGERVKEMVAAFGAALTPD